MKGKLGRRLSLSRSGIPVIVSIALALIYAVELQLAGSYNYHAAYSYITGLPEAYLWIVGPFLHSNHGHLIGNLVFFLILSVLVLPEASARDYLMLFFAASWFTASILPFLASGGPSFGVSGGNAALAGWGAVLGFRQYKRTVNEVESLLSLELARAVGIFAVLLILAVYNLGQGIGLVEVKSGVSAVGHATGALFGLTFGVLIPIIDNLDLI